MLYLAGVILLWHNLVPHHHEAAFFSEVSQNSIHNHEHGHQHDQAISHTHQSASDDEQNAGDPLNVPLHLQTVGDAVFKQSSNRFCEIPPPLVDVVCQQTYLSQRGFIQLFLSPPIFETGKVLKSPYYLSHSLRGPPFQILS